MADLLTPDDVAPFLGMDDTSADYALLNTLIDAAQETIEQLTNRTLATATTYTEYHDAGDTHIYVDRPPIVSISALYDSAWDKGSNAARTIASTGYITDSDDQGANYRMGKVELCNTESTFGGGRLDAKVTYLGGWTTSTIPADLKQAWCELVAFWFDNPERFSVGANNRHVPEPLANVIRRYTLRRNY